MPFAPGRVLLLLATSALWAADVPPRLSLDQLTAQSDAIVAGRVTRSWADMDPENRFIWTHYEIQVRDTLKGAPHPTVVISEPGGVLNGLQLQVSGSTRFADGEEVAVFLYRTPIGYMRTTNYGQGKFTLAADGTVHVSRLAHGTGVESLEGAKWNVMRARVTHILTLQQAARR
jgi:hypothetical protein